MKNINGFTTLELMVVVGIVAILTSMAIPSFYDWMFSYRVRSAVTDTKSLLEKAKIRAARDGSDCVVNFDEGNASLFINCLNRTVHLGNYDEGITLDVNPAGVDHLIFRPVGTSKLGGNKIGTMILTVQNQSKTRTYKVRITPAGSIITRKQ